MFLQSAIQKEGQTYKNPSIRTLSDNKILCLIIPRLEVFFISIFLVSFSKDSFGVLKFKHFIFLFRSFSSTKGEVSFGSSDKSHFFLTYRRIALFRFSIVPFSCGDCG